MPEHIDWNATDWGGHVHYGLEYGANADDESDFEGHDC